MEHAAGVESAPLFPFCFVSFGNGGLTLQSGPQNLPASASHKLLFDSRPLPFFILPCPLSASPLPSHHGHPQVPILILAVF